MTNTSRFWVSYDHIMSNMNIRSDVSIVATVEALLDLATYPESLQNNQFLAIVYNTCGNLLSPQGKHKESLQYLLKADSLVEGDSLNKLRILQEYVSLEMHEDVISYIKQKFKLVSITKDNAPFFDIFAYASIMESAIAEEEQIAYVEQLINAVKHHWISHEELYLVRKKESLLEIVSSIPDLHKALMKLYGSN